MTDRDNGSSGCSGCVTVTVRASLKISSATSMAALLLRESAAPPRVI
jgi:hypothetical protein